MVDITADYETGMLSNWMQIREPYAGFDWIHRNYDLFQEKDIIPRGKNLSGFRMLDASSNQPVQAVYFANIIAAEYSLSKSQDSQTPMVIANDKAFTPLKKFVPGEQLLQDVAFSRINADATHLPLDDSSINLITDFQGALWHQSENRTNIQQILSEYHRVLAENGSVVTENTPSGFHEKIPLFTAKKMIALGILSREDKYLTLADGRIFEISWIDGDSDHDSFLVLTKRKGTPYNQAHLPATEIPKPPENKESLVLDIDQGRSIYQEEVRFPVRMLHHLTTSKGLETDIFVRGRIRRSALYKLPEKNPNTLVIEASTGDILHGILDITFARPLDKGLLTLLDISEEQAAKTIMVTSYVKSYTTRMGIASALMNLSDKIIAAAIHQAIDYGVFPKDSTLIRVESDEATLPGWTSAIMEQRGADRLPQAGEKPIFRYPLTPAGPKIDQVKQAILERKRNIQILQLLAKIAKASEVPSAKIEDLVLPNFDSQTGEYINGMTVTQLTAYYNGL